MSVEELEKRLSEMEKGGAVRDQKILNLECCVKSIEGDIKEMKEKLINRLPLWATLLFTLLGSVCTGMAVFNLTH